MKSSSLKTQPCGKPNWLYTIQRQQKWKQPKARQQKARQIVFRIEIESFNKFI